MSASGRRARLGRWMRAKRERPRRSGCGECCRRRGGDLHYSGITTPRQTFSPWLISDDREDRARPGRRSAVMSGRRRASWCIPTSRSRERSPGAAGEPTTGKAPGPPLSPPWLHLPAHRHRRSLPVRPASRPTMTRPPLVLGRAAGEGQTLPVSGFVVRYPVTTALGDPPARAAQILPS